MQSTANKTDIRKLTLSELEVRIAEMGEKPFRAKQIYKWLWTKAAGSFAEMTDISVALREKLEEHFVIHPIVVHTSQQSNDGTVKSAFQLFDKHLIEGVLIPADDRMTACVSSQVGCSLTCKFCATGYMARKRNLEPGEIYDQVVAIDRQAKDSFQTPLTNIVYMGMGEPLLNYDNVLKSIHHITSPEGLNMSPKRITVSTAGVAKMIRKLGDDGVKFNLALSLHAADDDKRNQIMPINESNNLRVLRQALAYFYQKTKNKVTFEYIVFHNFNDSLEDADKLYRFAKSTGIPVKINIIEYNPISEADFLNAETDKIERFSKFLEAKGLVVNVRRSRGKDIDAACGQLANKSVAQP
jgi:23S rRNA (adenine2503-C2)-methyltransferase